MLFQPTVATFGTGHIQNQKGYKLKNKLKMTEATKGIDLRHQV